MDEIFTYRPYPQDLLYDRDNTAVGSDMIGTSPVERQIGELNRQTDIGVRWSISVVRHLRALHLTLASHPDSA